MPRHKGSVRTLLTMVLLMGLARGGVAQNAVPAPLGEETPGPGVSDIPSVPSAYELLAQPVPTAADTTPSLPRGLTGDWWGYRTQLREAGVTFQGNVTHFGFGIVDGIQVPVPPPLERGNAFKYTGRGEYNLIFDLEKLGGLPKGRLLVGAQHWYGEYANVGLRTGTFTPAIFPAYLPPVPNYPGVPYITDFLLTQPLSPELVLFAGKKNVLGVADQVEFAGGNGTDQFVSQALIANPAYLLGLPYTSFTAGVASPQKWGILSAYVFDPQNRVRDFFRVDDLFSEGVIVGGEVKVNTKFFGLPGEHHVGGIWKRVALTDLRIAATAPGTYPETPIANLPTLNDSWTLYYGADQFIQVDADNPKRGWGVFARASLSDGNPTPVRYFFSAGVGGSSPIRRDQGDTFGIGWFLVGSSTEFGPIPQALLGPQNGSGVELYYNIQLTPWLYLTPDIQFLQPGAGRIADDAFIYGIRLNMKL